MTAKEFRGIADMIAPGLKLLSMASKHYSMRASIRIDSDGYVSGNFWGFDEKPEGEGFTIYGYDVRSDGEYYTMDDVSGNDPDYYWIPLEEIGRCGDA